MIPQLPSREEWKEDEKRRRWFKSVRDTAVFSEPITAVRQLEATDPVKVLTDYHDQIVRIAGKDGSVVNGQNPQITAGYDGQKITVEGSHDSNSYQLNDGNGLQLNGGTNIVLKSGDIIKLHYNKERQIWVENYRSINRT